MGTASSGHHPALARQLRLASLDSNEVIQEPDDVLPHEVVHDDDHGQYEHALRERQSDRLERLHSVLVDPDDAEYGAQREAQRDEDKRQQCTVRTDRQALINADAPRAELRRPAFP